MSPKQTSLKSVPPVTRRSVKITRNMPTTTSGPPTSESPTKSDTKNVDIRVVMEMEIKNLDEIFIKTNNLHKSIVVFSVPKNTYDLLEPKLKKWLESKRSYIRNLFKEQVTANRLVYDGAYSLLKFPDTLKDQLDNLTIELLNFLRENKCLTPGTLENLPDWVKKKPDPEKTDRTNLHLEFGSANVPPLQSHHVTIDYENTNPNGVVDVEAILECYSLGAYYTDHLGQLVGLIFTIPLSESEGEPLSEPGL